MKDILTGVMFLFVIYQNAARSQVFRYYIENTDLVDKIVETLLGVEKGPMPFIDCAIKCNRCCACFGFNSLTKKCRIHQSCDVSNVSGDGAGWRYYVFNKLANPKNCQELYEGGCTASGVYTICPWDRHDDNYRCVNAFCDMQTQGGGWTVLQRRVDGLVNFNRSWVEYKSGFGILKQTFWIGNDVIHQLTREDNVSLYVSIKTPTEGKRFQVYNCFSISDEAHKYKLTLGEPTTGTLGDSMVSTEYTGEDNLLGMLFTTYDQDNDEYSDGNCGAIYGGGWWFKWCHIAHLHGPWASSEWIYPWYPSVISGTYIQETLMMVKPN